MRAHTFVRLARRERWSRNLLVLAAPAAAGVLGEPTPALRTAIALVCLCLAASGGYFFNDALDAEADRVHPVKCQRPVAAGDLSASSAALVGVGLFVAAIGLAYTARPQLVLVVGGFVLVNVAYSAWLKEEAVLDLACVAAGFVLRLIAGGVAVGVTISSWFLLVAGAFSFVVVSAARHAELRDLGDLAAAHRRSLQYYTTSYLNYVRAVASAVAVLSYCLWAVSKSSTAAAPVWFELSIVPFALGVVRYSLILERSNARKPEPLLVSDRTLVAIGCIWASVFAIAISTG